MAKVNNIIPVEDYLENIYVGLKEFIESHEEYCSLLDLNFSDNHVPEYDNINTTQLYLLRYAFSYMFEYKYLYKKFVPKKKTLTKPTLKILSIGCGNYLDYWGAASAANEINDTCIIKYIGVDQVDWNYKIDCRKQDEITFFQTNIASFLESQDKLDVNFIIFPKSISEFSDDDFRNMCSRLKHIKFSSSAIVLLFSIRDNANNCEFDMSRAAEIVNCFKNNKNNKFSASNFNRNRPYGVENKGIRSFDKSLVYPSHISDLILSLYKKCTNKTINSSKCQNCSKNLVRNPILTTKYITYSYAILTKRDD